jgi:hypothetical protein
VGKEEGEGGEGGKEEGEELSLNQVHLLLSTARLRRSALRAAGLRPVGPRAPVER